MLAFAAPSLDSANGLVCTCIACSLVVVVCSTVGIPCTSLLKIVDPSPGRQGALSACHVAFTCVNDFVTLLLFVPVIGCFDRKRDRRRN